MKNTEDASHCTCISGALRHLALGVESRGIDSKPKCAEEKDKHSRDDEQDCLTSFTVSFVISHFSR